MKTEIRRSKKKAEMKVRQRWKLEAKKKPEMKGSKKAEMNGRQRQKLKEVRQRQK